MVEIAAIIVKKIGLEFFSNTVSKLAVIRTLLIAEETSTKVLFQKSWFRKSWLPFNNYRLVQNHLFSYTMFKKNPLPFLVHTVLLNAFPFPRGHGAQKSITFSRAR